MMNQDFNFHFISFLPKLEKCNIIVKIFIVSIRIINIQFGES